MIVKLWGTRGSLIYWSYGYIEMLGEELAAVRSGEAMT